MAPPPLSSPLTGQTRLAYGIGELGTAIPVSLAAFFLLYFLTNVAGVSPAVAGNILLMGRIWDAINDPLVGWLSDRTQSRWGRRYPWMVYGAVPLGLICFLQWLVPPVSTPWAVVGYYAIISLLAYALFTAVQLPYTALLAELTQDYDERTQLNGLKSAFSIGGSIVGLLLAQGVFSVVAQPQTQYALLGGISGVILVIAIAICVVGTSARYWQMDRYRQMPTRPQHSLGQELKSLWQNRPFYWLVGLYLGSWMSVQLTASLLPYFVQDWMGLPAQHVTQMAIAVQGMAMLCLPLWSLVAHRTSKHRVYFWGVPLAIVGLGGLSVIPAQAVGLMYGLAVLTGMGVSTLYLIPLAMLPDVIDLDEYETGRRREGMYVSVMVFLQKVGLAIALFLTGQFLSWSGFQAHLAVSTTQSPTTLMVIRLLTGGVPALMLGVGLVCAWGYPLNRQRHDQIRLQLEQRRHPAKDI